MQRGVDEERGGGRVGCKFSLRPRLCWRIWTLSCANFSHTLVANCTKSFWQSAIMLILQKVGKSFSRAAC